MKTGQFVVAVALLVVTAFVTAYALAWLVMRLLAAVWAAQV